MLFRRAIAIFREMARGYPLLSDVTSKVECLRPFLSLFFLSLARAVALSGSPLSFIAAPLTCPNSSASELHLLAARDQHAHKEAKEWKGEWLCKEGTGTKGLGPREGGDMVFVLFYRRVTATGQNRTEYGFDDQDETRNTRETRTSGDQTNQQRDGSGWPASCVTPVSNGPTSRRPCVSTMGGGKEAPAMGGHSRGGNLVSWSGRGWPRG